MSDVTITREINGETRSFTAETLNGATRLLKVALAQAADRAAQERADIDLAYAYARGAAYYIADLLQAKLNDPGSRRGWHIVPRPMLPDPSGSGAVLCRLEVAHKGLAVLKFYAPQGDLLTIEDGAGYVHAIRHPAPGEPMEPWCGVGVQAGHYALLAIPNLIARHIEELIPLARATGIDNC